MKKRKEIVIFGAGGQANSVAELAIDLGYKIKHFIAQNKEKRSLFGAFITNEIDLTSNCFIAIAIGENKIREKLYLDISKIASISQFPKLIHPSATISQSSKIDYGVIVLPNAVVGPNSKVSKFSILNIGSSLDHDSKMEDFSSLGPLSVTGGNVLISRLAKIEIGAVIQKGIKVAENCTIGANSFLNKDTNKNSIYYGSPARYIREKSN